MAETAAASAIVPEVLNKDNYDEWKFRLITYLIAQDLWDVIVEDQPIGLKEFLKAKGLVIAEDLEDEEKANDEASKEVQSEAEIKAWLRKNTTALHVIHISCGRDAFVAILGIISAKIAWKTLEDKYKPLWVTESSNSQDKLEAPIINTDENLVYQPFFKAVETDKWSYAQEFLSKHPEALSLRHPLSGRTALHIAVRHGYEQMVKELIQVMPEEDQEILENEGFTALLTALATGRTSIAKCMVDMNKKKLGIPFKGIVPVCSAFGYGHIDLARYLYSITPQEYLLADEGWPAATLIFSSMKAEQYDIALDLLQKCPNSTIISMLKDDDSITLLEDMLTAFPTASPLNFWQQWIYDRIDIQPMVPATGNICVHVSNSEDSQMTRRNITCSGLLKQFASNARKLLGSLSATLKTSLGIKHLYKLKLANTCLSKVLERIRHEMKCLDDGQLLASTYISNAIKHAIANGALEFIVQLTKANKRLSRTGDKETGRNMIMIAIQFRQEKIVSFFMHENTIENLLNVVDKSGNSPLHMMGLLPPSSHYNTIPGPALRMQKELQWFQEVESLIGSKIVKSTRNAEGMTAREYFTKNHEELRKEGEKWMKDTASSYSVVAALIVTMTFAAGFMVPGVTNESMSTLSRKKWFLVFLISDSVSLFSSTTSVIMSLGILTSRYYEEAFLTSLPTKLILGMSALFWSIATMMLCFCAALYEILQGQLWILIPIILLSSLPVCLFIRLQFPLLVEIFKSTYGSGIGIAPKIYKKRWFFW